MVGSRHIRVSHWLLVVVLAAVTLAWSPAASAGSKKDAGGDLWVSDFLSVLRYDQVTGMPVDGSVEPRSGGLFNAQGIAIGPDGNLYVASFESRQILRYSGSTGSFVDVFVPAGSGGLGNPNDVTFGPDGNLYVADGFRGTNTVLRYDGRTGSFVDVFASGGGIRNPHRLTFGPDRNLFVGNATTSDVLRYDGRTGAAKPAQGNSGAVFVAGQPGPFNTRVAFGPDGDLFVGTGETRDVSRYNGRTGAAKGVFIPDGATGDMTFGPDGNLYINDYLGDSVLRYDGTTGSFIDTFVAPGSDGLRRPTGLTFSLTKAGCKNGGWVNFGFKNQGQCIKTVLHTGDYRAGDRGDHKRRGRPSRR